MEKMFLLRHPGPVRFRWHRKGPAPTSSLSDGPGLSPSLPGPGRMFWTMAAPLRGAAQRNAFQAGPPVVQSEFGLITRVFSG
jgi:hypothetical protein